MRWRRNCSMRLTTLTGVGARSRVGRDERSCNPARPWALNRCTHLFAVRVLTLDAAAAASKVIPCLITEFASSNRPLGVSLALLCNFICSSLPGVASMRSFSHQLAKNNLRQGHS